jgi:hypothetical protein
VYFYESPDLASSLFELPKSYYLKRIGISGDFYKVECYGESDLTPLLIGYVLVGQVEFSAPVTDPFLNFNVVTNESTVLYADKNMLKTEMLIFKNRTLGYYGKAYANDNTIIYMVTFNNKIGYVKEIALIPFTVPTHSIPILNENLSTDKNLDGLDNQNLDKSDKILKILIIVAVFTSAIIITGLIILPDKKEKRLYKVDDEV